MLLWPLVFSRGRPTRPPGAQSSIRASTFIGTANINLWNNVLRPCSPAITDFAIRTDTLSPSPRKSVALAAHNPASCVVAEVIRYRVTRLSQRLKFAEFQSVTCMPGIHASVTIQLVTFVTWGGVNSGNRTFVHGTTGSEAPRRSLAQYVRA